MKRVYVSLLLSLVLILPCTSALASSSPAMLYCLDDADTLVWPIQGTVQSHLLELYSGPGENYLYWGSYAPDAQEISCISRARDEDGHTWVLVDFSDGFMRWRGYTPLSPILVDPVKLPLELPADGEGMHLMEARTFETAKTRLGPGAPYAQSSIVLGEGDYPDGGILMMSESNWGLLDVLNVTPAVRVWVSLDDIFY